MKHVCLCAITLSLGVLLSACGGGGSGRGSMESMVPSTPTSPTMPDMQTAFSGTETRDITAAAQAVTNLLNAGRQPGNPIFGSVAQAFTAGLSGVTGVETSFNGGRFALQINRRNGSSTTLDTDHDLVSDVEEVSPSENLITNRNAVQGYVYRLNEREFTAAGVGVEWSNTDFADYLSLGYWLHVDIGTQDAEIGAFIDGPEFAAPIQVPVTGTATYNGRAGGVYLTQYGTDGSPVPSGTFEQGEYEGRATLTADFGSNRISGLIDNIGLHSIVAVAPDGETAYEPSLVNTDYEVILGAAPISQAGTFWGQSVTLTHPQLQVTTSDGSWAGRFSTIDDNVGNPRSVAGTHRAHVTYAGGTEGVFAGAFYGATERFQ